MDELDRLDPDALYLQIAHVLRERIRAGTYAQRRPLPAVVELCREFEVSKNTVRAALAVLAEEGLTRGVRGRGTFVVGRPPEPEEPAAPDAG